MAEIPKRTLEDISAGPADAGHRERSWARLNAADVERAARDRAGAAGGHTVTEPHNAGDGGAPIQWTCGPGECVHLDSKRGCEVCGFERLGASAQSSYAPTQVGGSHYSRLAIQPVDYMLANNLGYCEGNVVKYVSRWRNKGGVEDLEKAKQYLQFLIDAESKPR